jgi:hypothetical protein
MLSLFPFCQVFVRLSKLGIAMSFSAVITMLDQIGSHHDAEVLKWCDDLRSKLKKTKVTGLYRYNYKVCSIFT